jgi:hypothetical protein
VPFLQFDSMLARRAWPCFRPAGLAEMPNSRPSRSGPQSIAVP